MTWFSFVFPNTALVTATFAIGKAFKSHAIQVVGCVMTCMLIVLWAFVMSMMVRAVMMHEIMWPQKGEDKDEGGFNDEKFKAESSVGNNDYSLKCRNSDMNSSTVLELTLSERPGYGELCQQTMVVLTAGI
jgi:hypothetical protein